MEEPPGGPANASGPAPLWPNAGWEATASNWGARVTCRECGAESTGAAGVCARCGAPLGLEQPAAAGPPAFGPGPAGWPGSPAPPAAGWPGNSAPPPGWPGFQAPPAGWTGTPAPPMAWDPHYYWASGQQPPSRGNSRRWALIVAGVGGALLLTLIAVIWIRVASTTAASASAGPTPAANQLTFDQLAPGDCLAGTNMGLGGGGTWPDYVTRVPCTHKHEAEVFFAKDIWPQSLAYPGKQAVDDQARARCTAAFDAYDGTDYEESAFSYTQIVDEDSASWAAGNRSLECVAYLPFSTGPSGATPVDYSIKGSKQ